MKRIGSPGGIGPLAKKVLARSAAGAGAGLALGAYGANKAVKKLQEHEKKAGMLNRVVSRIQGAGKKLQDQAKERAVVKGKEVLHEIADNPETKKRLEQVARDAGHHAVDQAARHPAVAQAKRGLERGAKQLAGVTAGSAAVSAGTSIYQGNKTRRAMRELDHDHR